MKKNNALTNIQTALNAIKRGNICPVYLLTGAEDYLVFRTRKILISEIKKQIPETAVELKDGQKLRMTDLVTELNSPSLFDPFRIILVRDAPYFETKLSAGDETKFLSWLTRQKDDTQISATLICTARKIDKRIGLVRQIDKLCPVLKFNPAESYERGDIQHDPYYPVIERQLLKAGKRITPKAWFTLRQRTLNNLWAVVNAIEPLIVYTDQAPEIEVNDVNDLVSMGDETPVFAITEALGNKNAKQLREHLDNILMTGTHPLMIMKLLSSRIRMLLSVKSILKKDRFPAWNASVPYWQFRKEMIQSLNKVIDGDASWANVLSGKHPYSLYLTFKQAAKFDLKLLQRGLEELARVDLSLKSSAKSPQVMIEMALMPLCV